MHDIATKPDLEAIMRRLKGNREPDLIPARSSVVPHSFNDETVNELKQIAKMLGAKLKTALEEKQSLQGLLAQKENEIASMRLIFSEKDETISSLQKAPFPQEEEELKQLRKAQNIWASGQEQFKAVEEELLHLRKGQGEWENERGRLLKELENERSTKQSVSPEASAQVLRMAMTCRQLEDEIHALTCERAATVRQYRELQEANDHLQAFHEKCLKQIAVLEANLFEKEEEHIASRGAFENLTTSFNNLQEQNLRDNLEIENHRNRIDELQTLEGKLQEDILQSNKQISFLQDRLESTEKNLQSLQKEYSSLQEAFDAGIDEKNRALLRIQEVEEVLILKLTVISELQEQIASLNMTSASLQQNNDALNHALQQALDELKQLNAEHASLLDAHARTKTQFQESEKNNALLIERTEQHECLLNTVKDVKEQALGLLKILENGKTPFVSVAKLVEELSIKTENVSGILVEDRFEQHDLF